MADLVKDLNPFGTEPTKGNLHLGTWTILLIWTLAGVRVHVLIRVWALVHIWVLVFGRLCDVLQRRINISASLAYWSIITANPRRLYGVPENSPVLHPRRPLIRHASQIGVKRLEGRSLISRVGYVLRRVTRAGFQRLEATRELPRLEIRRCATLKAVEKYSWAIVQR